MRKKAIAIVTKSGIKYTIGGKKTVSEVLNEINACQSDFYQVHENCAIRVSEIASVEMFEYEAEQEEKDD